MEMIAIEKIVIVILTGPKRREHSTLESTRAWRQREQAENIGKSFYCGFYKKGGAGKEAGETGLGFVSVHNFIRLWGLGAVVWDLALG